MLTTSNINDNSLDLTSQYDQIIWLKQLPTRLIINFDWIIKINKWLTLYFTLCPLSLSQSNYPTETSRYFFIIFFLIVENMYLNSMQRLWASGFFNGLVIWVSLGPQVSQITGPNTNTDRLFFIDKTILVDYGFTVMHNCSHINLSFPLEKFKSNPNEEDLFGTC